MEIVKLPVHVVNSKNCSKGKNATSDKKQVSTEMENNQFSEVIIQLLKTTKQRSEVENISGNKKPLNLKGSLSKKADKTAKSSPDNKAAVFDVILSQNNQIVKLFSGPQNIKPGLLQKGRQELNHKTQAQIVQDAAGEKPRVQVASISRDFKINDVTPGVKSRTRKQKTGNIPAKKLGDNPSLNKKASQLQKDNPELKNDRFKLKINDKSRHKFNNSIKPMKGESETSDVKREIAILSFNKTRSSKNAYTVEDFSVSKNSDDKGKHFNKAQTQQDFVNYNVKPDFAKSEALAKSQATSQNQTTHLKPESGNLAEQMVQKMKLMVGNKQSSLEIHLKPEHLGKVKIQLHSHEGTITARIITDNGQTANLLNSSMHQIKENLEQQGIKLQHFGVDVGSQGQGENPGYDGRGNEKGGYSSTVKAVSSESDIMMDTNKVEERTASVSCRKLDILA
ncbi:MAG: flagellar hook-length control protein FliK [Clostridia bacterium]|nr:flagellar hook-length control protein FliK [Clostridia bacterium]